MNDATRAHIPEFVQLLQADARSLRRASLVSPPFLQATLNAATEYEPVATLLGRPVAEQWQEAIDADLWLAVASEARALLKGLTASNPFAASASPNCRRTTSVSSSYARSSMNGCYRTYST